ncbi:MAG TPA: filamentous hemagglutinin N-terminal domain-containing protein [Caulobacteraceae bacterium]
MATCSCSKLTIGRDARSWPIFGLTLASLIGGASLASSAAAASAPVLPTGGQVRAGAAAIGAPAGGAMTINQSSSRAIIDWSSFSIGQGGAVQFNNGAGATLNRVTGTAGSQIDGLLSGTGSVYLINPGGVIIGKSGVVKVGGTFVASSLDVADSAFMGGGDLTFSGSSGAAVINYGKIGALGGDVALIASQVQNYGEIDAANGTAGLIAGTQVVLRDKALDDGKFAVLLGGSGTSATNSGVIAAANAELRAEGGNVYALAGNTASVIKATGVTASDGKVFLVAGSGGGVAIGPAAQISARTASGAGGAIVASGDVVFNQGRLDAAGAAGGAITISARSIANAGVLDASGSQGSGGKVSITASGSYVETQSGQILAAGTTSGGAIDVEAASNLFTSGSWSAASAAGAGGAITAVGGATTLDDASFNASGVIGGSIRVGGDFHGAGTLAHAQTTTVTPGSVLKADAALPTQGGSVVVWSDNHTAFFGDVSAQGGGRIEISSAAGLEMGGLANAGLGGQVLFDPKNIVIDAATGVYPQYQLIDPDKSGGDGFAATVLPLSGGNIVVTAPLDSFSAKQSGAAYLFNGVTGALISTLVGSQAGDSVGNSGVTALSNGNYVVRSSAWVNGSAINAGAATWGSGASGVTGAVSAANSLVGSQAGDAVGLSVTTLTNGDYVVSSPFWANGSAIYAGAVTWGSGASGVAGVVTAANSLVGSQTSDNVGSSGVTALPNGNYVVRSGNWANGSATLAGAVTWGSGASGVSGAVSAANSLVGSQKYDYVGSAGVTTLINGNFVVDSPFWANGSATAAGAATWGNGASGVAGVVSAANSLVGSQTNDQVGFSGVTALTNGAYVVASPYWANGSATHAGAATWGSGARGVAGAVSAANSLVGSQANDEVGYFGVTALANGNYVVDSAYWANGSTPDAGAATWGNGATGITGVVSAANSLVGSQAYDEVGQTVAALTNGDYVVNSHSWSNGSVPGAGAATWGSGASGVTGAVSAANSLVGSQAGDAVGLFVTALTNGDYVVSSPYWANGSATAAGAVTWGNGASGLTGAVSTLNSLVGSQKYDYVGNGGVTALTNGDYVVSSYSWANGSAVRAGAATWGNGAAGVAGAVSASNSLVGSQGNDAVGIHGVTALSNGDYVVNSPYWANGSVTRAGAATWGNGASGVAGVVTAANSLVGSQADDQVGAGVTALSNGDYVVNSSNWANGSEAQAGAVTWGADATGVSGAVSAANSLVGTSRNALLEFRGDGGATTTFVASGGGQVFIGITDLNALTYSRAQDQTVTITPSALAAELATGSAITLQASNDITVNSAVDVPGSSGGALALDAGRSIALNASITTANGNLTLLANTKLSAGVVDSERDPGAATIAMAPGVSLNAGTGNVVIDLSGGAGKTNTSNGAISLGSITAASIDVENGGASTGSDISIASGGVLTASGSGDAIVLAADGNFINSAGAGALSASSGVWLIYTQATGTSGGAPTGDSFGGLVAKSYYGDQYTFGSGTLGAFASAPNAGDRFVYGYQPTVTVNPATRSVTYDGRLRTDPYRVIGLQNGDNQADAVQGMLATTSQNVGVYGFASGLTSDENYAINYGAGTLTIDPKALVASLVGTVEKTYDGNTVATLTSANYSLSGVIRGDDVSLNDPTVGVYGNPNVGQRRVRVHGLFLTGAAAGNYTVNKATGAKIGLIVAAADGFTFFGLTGASDAVLEEARPVADAADMLVSSIGDDRGRGMIP